jgi:[ribosomal protein S5]-alanine N-acetyltransferase
MLFQTVFETTRLHVRNLVESDFDTFHEMQADDEVMRYTTGRGLDEAENRRQLKMCIDCYSREGNDFWVWAIIRKLDGQFVGTCAVVPNERRPEIGYRLLRRFFGMGYGQEICNGLVEYCIHEQRLAEIIAYADVRNLASTKILDRSRLQFVEETTNENGITDRFYHWSADGLLGKTSENNSVNGSRR